MKRGLPARASPIYMERRFKKRKLSDYIREFLYFCICRIEKGFSLFSNSFNYDLKNLRRYAIVRLRKVLSGKRFALDIS